MPKRWCKPLWIRLWALAALAWAGAHAQDLPNPWVGQPSLSRFTPAETNAHPYSFSALPMASGEVYVGNSEGLLRYFGRRWQLIELPGGSAARSLARGADGRVYVGGYQHFGVLERQLDGRFSFHSLERDFFPDSVGAPLGEIWDTVATKRGVYFASSEQIFFVGYAGERATIALPATLLTLFAHGEHPVVALRNHQLLHLDGNTLQPWLTIPGRARGLVSDASGASLLLNDRGDLYRLEPARAVPVSHAAQALLRSSQPYTMTSLPNGDYAIGTLSGDLVRLSADLQHFLRWPTGSAPVIGLGVDAEDHLWAATEVDIVRVSLSTAWSLIDRSNGLRGPVTHAAEYAGRLYVSTSVGLFGAERDAAGSLVFKVLALDQKEVNHLAVTDAGLLVGARDGIYLWRNEQLQTVHPDALIWRLFPSRQRVGRVYAVEDSGLLVLDRAGDGYVLTQQFSEASYRFDEIAEASDGSLTIDRLQADPMQFALDPASGRLREPQSLPLGTARDPDENAAVVGLDGQALIATDQALYVHDGTRFSALGRHPLIDAGLAPGSDLRVRTCGDGSVYAFNARRLAHRGADATQAFVELHPMDGGARGIVDVQCSAADGSAWVGTWSGMVRFDAGAPRSEPKPRAPLMERVRVYPLDANATWLPLLSDGRELPAFRRLRFDYASPTLSGSVRYQSRLRGYDSAWVNDANSGVREFGTLPAGSYALEARVVDERGEPGPVLSYAFTIAPAWYQTAPGVAALVLALIGVLSGLVTWRSLALRRRNRELEAQVAERTDALAQRSIELEAANHRLAALADLDGLTGVANRRKLQFELEGAFKDARAMEAHLALLLIDVDQFKHFNDTYGHLVGDERLRAISERLSGWVGPGELLARYGGEEFVMLMPGSSVDVARERAEAIRRDAHQVGRDGERSTVSIGVAELRLTKAQSTAQLFEYADLALYRAKHAGRDRVEVY